jgi:hypothetical protein
MTSREHTIRTERRTGTLTVTEHADRIALRLTFDRYGELGDEAEIARQLAPLLARFDADPRPLDFSAPDLGQRAVIDAGRDGPAFSVLVEAARR